jgi:hypothetical protein
MVCRAVLFNAEPVVLRHMFVAVGSPPTPATTPEPDAFGGIMCTPATTAEPDTLGGIMCCESTVLGVIAEIARSSHRVTFSQTVHQKFAIMQKLDVKRSCP